jgi:uncharacterized membrane protein YraQ (UPF0718 family)
MTVEQLNSAFTLFLSLLVEAMPFLLLGVLFSGALLFFIDERKLVAALPKHPLLGSIAGGCVGFLFPVCECGNVPVARRLLMQGAPPAVAIGFLLAAPTVNPVVIWATWIAFREQPEIVVLRVVISLAIAVIIGWVFSSQADMRPLLQPAITKMMPVAPRTSPSSEAASPLLQSGTFLLGGRSGSLLQLDAPSMLAQVEFSPSRLPLRKKFGLLVDNTIQEFRELAGVLVVGSAIAALLQVFVPRDWILSLGQGPFTSILAMMGLAAVVSICSTVDAFFALSFASLFTTGSLLAFLIFGPMIDLKAIGLLLSIFKPRAILYLFILAGQLTIAATLFLNLYVS